MTHHYKEGERHLVCPKDGGCRVHPKHYKCCSDDKLYRRFQEEHPDCAAKIKRTMFKLLRPFFVVRPESRTCECPYCKIASQIVADYRKIFGLCHGEDCPCECSRCERGDCKDKSLHPFYSIDALMAYILCDPGEDECESFYCSSDDEQEQEEEGKELEEAEGEDDGSDSDNESDEDEEDEEEDETTQAAKEAFVNDLWRKAEEALKSGSLPKSKRERKKITKRASMPKYRFSCLRQECKDCGFFEEEGEGDKDEECSAPRRFKPELFNCPLEVDGEDEVCWTETQVMVEVVSCLLFSAFRIRTCFFFVFVNPWLIGDACVLIIPW